MFTKEGLVSNNVLNVINKRKERLKEISIKTVYSLEDISGDYTIINDLELLDYYVQNMKHYISVLDIAKIVGCNNVMEYIIHFRDNEDLSKFDIEVKERTQMTEHEAAVFFASLGFKLRGNKWN